MKRVAIIIPAYKATFLPAALDSIAAQTCKDFTLYVGDDCSPEPIGDIVERYRDKIELVYQRYDTNLGGKDLVAQWERCIALSQNEPYVWLFSDDDVLESNCVEQLIKTIEATGGAYDLYHFDVKEINEEGKTTKIPSAYPLELTAYDYYKGKTSGIYRSYVVENVFSRRIYEEKGGFKKFDMAWGSDVATWCIFCGNRGMYKISDAHVLWRRSSQNITPDRSQQTAERKLMSECSFLNWTYEYFHFEKNIREVNEIWFVKVMRHYEKLVSKESAEKAYNTFFCGHNYKCREMWARMLIHLPANVYKLYMYICHL